MASETFSLAISGKVAETALGDQGPHCGPLTPPGVR